MKYQIAPMWLASFFENDSVLRTNREQLTAKTP